MKKRFVKTSVAFVLFFALTLGMLPLFAQTADADGDPNRITYVSVAYEKPVVGQYPDYYCEIVGENYYMYKVDSPWMIQANENANDIFWYDLTEGDEGTQTMSGHTPFQRGHSYMCEVWLTAKSDYHFFSGDYKDLKIDIYMNGKEGSLGHCRRRVDGSPDRNYISIQYFYDLTENINEVRVSVTAPAAGEHVSFGRTVHTPHVSLLGDMNWVDVSTGDTLGTNDVFVKGRSYTVVMTLKPDDGYSFAVNEQTGGMTTRAYINGILAYQENLGNREKRMYLSYTFACGEPDIISDVGITVEAPYPGQTPSANVTLDGFYTLHSIDWYNVTDNRFVYEYNDGDPIVDDQFRSGKVYRVSIWVTSLGSSKFAYNGSTHKPAVTAKVNGLSASAYVAYEQDPEQTIEIVYTFPVADITVGTAEYSVTPPELGETPDYNVVPASKVYYATDVKWTDVTENREMTSSDKFEDGHSYKVFFISKTSDALYPTPVFSTAANGSTQVKAYVNGNTATPYSQSSYVKRFITVEYTFPKLNGNETRLTSVALNITSPEKGSSPVFSASTSTSGARVEGRNYNVFRNGVAWYDMTDSKYMSYDDVFLPGHAYKAEICVIPQTGYKYRVGTEGEPDVFFTVNGKKATGYSKSEYFDYDKRITVEYAFASLADGSLILYGDANGDKKVSSSDIVRLKKYFASLDPDTGLSSVEISPGADANGDEKISSSDIVRLKKYFAALDPDTGESSVILGPDNWRERLI